MVPRAPGRSAEPVLRGDDVIVGIDLGTTHTVVAYADLDDPAGGDTIRLFEIEQLVAPGEVAARPQLPSQRYHPAPGEIAAGELQLPWREPVAGDVAEAIVGQLARRLGGQVPGRLVTSAKSWLSHAAVDRTAPILPWGAETDVPKVSPLFASASYLAHVRAAWNHRFPQAPLEAQQVVLTVPASFDDGARALTVEAARLAGLLAPRLLEEPQAAFQDWLHRHRATLAADLAGTRLVLVCDVGGGTTDLTLIRVQPGAADGEPPTLERIAVGDHLMLGGDNMDLALAHRLEARLGGGRLSAARLAQLGERSRAAKEALLAADAPERLGVTLLGGGSKLVGGARTVELTRDEVEDWLVDGFFPHVAADDRPTRGRAGLIAFGLPYASDAAITRHVAAFLHQHAGAIRAALGDADAPASAVPDTLLLNGGVFRAAALRERLVATLSDWRGAPVRLLDDADPDLAVARGAVAHALARAGRAPRIGGGSARTYFLLQAEGRPAVCLLPQGTPEGEERRLPERRFVLRVGQPVRFHLASQTAAADGAPPAAGALVVLHEGDHVQLPPVATVVEAGDDGRRDIPVELATRLTELGTLELHCLAADDPGRRWRLEFQLRGTAEDDDRPPEGDATSGEGVPPGFEEALQRIERVFGARTTSVDTKEVKQLRGQLERLLGTRERWSPPLLRRLYDALWQRARGRRRSSDHERVWLNLAGYCLRPGFGVPLDDWRVEQLWTIFDAGVQHPKDAQVGSEWWTLWRRVAGGLPEAAQRRLLDDFAQNLESARKGGPKLPAGVVRGAVDDMLRLGAALERVPADHKVEVGDWLLERLQGAAAGDEALSLWAIGRLGARQPLHGSAHAVVPPEAAARWLEAVLARDWKRSEGAAYAAAHLARRTDDRARDLPEALRAEVIARLEAARAAPSWVAMVRDGGALDEVAARQAYGESLPVGLKLVG